MRSLLLHYTPWSYHTRNKKKSKKKKQRSVKGKKFKVLKNVVVTMTHQAGGQCQPWYFNKYHGVSFLFLYISEEKTKKHWEHGSQKKLCQVEGQFQLFLCIMDFSFYMCHFVFIYGCLIFY